MPKAIVNAMVYDFDRFYPSGYVLFDEKILKAGDMKDFEDDNYELIDGKGHLVMPSLVIGHTHIYSTFARGWMNSFKYENFMDILEGQWWKLDRGLEEQSIYYSGIVNAVDHVKNGVTTIIDHHASGSVSGALEALKKAVVDDVGLRGMFAFETSDRFNVEQCIQENRRFLDNHQTDKVSGHFGLHASLSLSEETLQRVSERLADAPIHIHVGESEMDQNDSLKQYGERVVTRLHRHGLLNKDSILTHALYVSDSERELIAENDCVVALNPSSNMNNGVGIPDYPALKEKGIRVIVGNDGLSSSVTTEYLNLLYASHALKKTPEAMNLGDIQKIIDDTYDYVSARFGIKLGRFQKDYEADLLMLPYAPPTPIHKDNALGHLFFGCFNSFKPRNVFVAGNPVVKDYEVRKNLQETYQKAKAHAQDLWQRIEEGESS